MAGRRSATTWLGWTVGVAVLASSTTAGAGTSVPVPAGTKVGLEFRTPVYTARSANGDPVNFNVVADVLVNRYIVIKHGTPLTGRVTSATPPGRFGRPAKVTIGYMSVPAVDHKPVPLNGLTITPAGTDRRRLGAVGTATGVALLTGSAWGLLAGGVVHGGNIEVPVGAVMGDMTQTDVTVRIP